MAIDVSAEVNPRYRFLTGVATLRVRDGVQVIEVRFLGDRRLIDVDAPLGAACLDACDLPGIEAGWDRAQLCRAAPDLAHRVRRQEQVIAFDADVRNARDEHRYSVALGCN